MRANVERALFKENSSRTNRETLTTRRVLFIGKLVLKLDDILAPNVGSLIPVISVSRGCDRINDNQCLYGQTITCGPVQRKSGRSAASVSLCVKWEY